MHGEEYHKNEQQASANKVWGFYNAVESFIMKKIQIFNVLI